MRDQTFTINGQVNANMVSIGNGNYLALPAASPGSMAHAQPVFGIVTALPEEFAAVSVLLDDAQSPSTISGDRAQYVLGTLPSRDAQRPHEMVLTLLGD